MKLLLLTLCSILVTILGQKFTEDYCKPNLCRYGTHIACRHNGQFSYSCPTGRKLVKLGEKTRQYLLKLHNNRRNLIAGGFLRGFQRACRMTTMQWDDELAKLAALNVKQCEMRHDDCHNTKRFKYSGQNLSKWPFMKPTPLHDFLKIAVKQWFQEYKNAQQSYIDSYPSSYSGPVIGHFTSMVHERNTHLGCAVSTWKTREGSYKLTYYLLACNYATTNYYDFPIYKSCNRAAKNCKTGRNKKYPNLCSLKEAPKINIWIKNGQRYY